MNLKNVIAILIIVGVAITATAFATGDEKVTVCHFPEGNPQNMQTISIGAGAAEKHIAEHKVVVDGVTYADYKGECRKQATEATACAIMKDITTSYVEPTEKIDRAIDLAVDLQSAVAKYSPTIATDYYQKSTDDQQHTIQSMIISRFTKTACTDFCNGTVDPKTGLTTCATGSYVDVLGMATADVLGDLTR